MQGPQGGGRNIGEACHMYDLFRFLAGAPLASVAATAIDPGALPYSAQRQLLGDAAATRTAAWRRSSTPSLGPQRGLPKERVEVFCDGEAYVLDDFKSLTRASDGQGALAGGEADKGHFEELSPLRRRDRHRRARARSPSTR